LSTLVCTRAIDARAGARNQYAKVDPGLKPEGGIANSHVLVTTDAVACTDGLGTGLVTRVHVALADVLCAAGAVSPTSCSGTTCLASGSGHASSLRYCVGIVSRAPARTRVSARPCCVAAT